MVYSTVSTVEGLGVHFTTVGGTAVVCSVVHCSDGTSVLLWWNIRGAVVVHWWCCGGAVVVLWWYIVE